MTEIKFRLVEAVLIPISVTFASIVGSKIIADAQIESAKEISLQTIKSEQIRTESELELKLVESIIEKVLDPEKPNKLRVDALDALKGISPKNAAKIAFVVANMEKENIEINVAAQRELAFAEQKIADKEIPLEATLCKDFSKYTRQEWRAKFMLPTRKSTWHVFVASFSGQQPEALVLGALENMLLKHKNIDFRMIFTSGKSNNNSAIILASGLEKNLAQKIARFAKKCGISNDAYAFEQKL